MVRDKSKYMTIQENKECIDAFAKRRCSILVNKKEIMIPQEHVSMLNVYENHFDGTTQKQLTNQSLQDFNKVNSVSIIQDKSLD